MQILVKIPREYSVLLDISDKIRKPNEHEYQLEIASLKKPEQTDIIR